MPYTHVYDDVMDCDRMVIVPEAALDDICALAERAAERIQATQPGPTDSLVFALRGAAREIRAHSILDPCPG